MKLTKFGILANKTTSLFTSIRDSNKKLFQGGVQKFWKLRRGGGVNFGGRFWKNPEGRGPYGKSLPWGWYGYFLEPHIIFSPFISLDFSCYCLTQK